MNIAKILKDCPVGTKLYSPIYGKVIFDRTVHEQVATDKYLNLIKCFVHTKIDNKSIIYFNEEGKWLHSIDGECMLFPSQENRDWSTFKVSKKEYEFKPFDKVLVRDYGSDVWECNIFSHTRKIANETAYVCVGRTWRKCIPYIGNEHLLGTIDTPNN